MALRNRSAPFHCYGYSTVKVLAPPEGTTRYFNGRGCGPFGRSEGTLGLRNLPESCPPERDQISLSVARALRAAHRPAPTLPACRRFGCQIAERAQGRWRGRGETVRGGCLLAEVLGRARKKVGELANFRPFPVAVPINAGGQRGAREADYFGQLVLGVSVDEQPRTDFLVDDAVGHLCLLSFSVLAKFDGFNLHPF